MLLMLLFSAFLLLQRDPELKRRVTNPYALQPPRIAPRAVAAACASHPFIKRLNGLPYAVGLGVAILNKLFAYEKMAKEVCEGAGAHKTLPPSSKLEPLDRALRVLDFPEVFDPDLRRLRDELNHVVLHGRRYRPDGAPALQPDVLISLTAPKLCAAHFRGVGGHYLGGRFVPKSIEEKYGFVQPPFRGTEQVVKLDD